MLTCVTIEVTAFARPTCIAPSFSVTRVAASVHPSRHRHARNQSARVPPTRRRCFGKALAQTGLRPPTLADPTARCASPRRRLATTTPSHRCGRRLPFGPASASRATRHRQHGRMRCEQERLVRPWWAPKASWTCSAHRQAYRLPKPGGPHGDALLLVYSCCLYCGTPHSPRRVAHWQAVAHPQC
jgi:hypothetical protein